MSTCIESITYTDTDDPAITTVTTVVDGTGNRPAGSYSEDRTTASANAEQYLLQRQGWTETELPDGSVRFTPAVTS